ncbi:MAG: lytic murein transglycosylase [Candidatus Paceibacterota bacterium]
MSCLQKLVISIIVFTFVVYGPAFVWAQNTDLSPEERTRLERQLKELEEQMAETDSAIGSLQAEGASLERDIAILDGQIKRARLQVQSTELEIQQLSESIYVFSGTIEELTEKLAKDQKSLAEIIRKTREIDDYSLAEFVLSSQTLSDFLSDLDSFLAIKEEMINTFEAVRNTRAQTSEKKEGLESERTDKEILQSQLILAQKEVEYKEAEKQKLLQETKGQESLYKTLRQSQDQLAAQIRARLFPLRDAGEIPFGTAVKYAQQASKQTGVRASLILAVLSQESDLGRNVGNCYVKDLETGDGVGKNTGTPFSGIMKVSRDTVPFERVTSALGRDWSTTPVSCPQPGGYGGAMGPTQFIPSTWEMYQGRLASLLGVTADPWNARHAITATGLYLQDVGATGGVYLSEHTAAAKYYAGGNWASSGQHYANSVMQKAANFQKDIDLIN